MPTSLRQRRRFQNSTIPNDDNNDMDEEMEIFVQQFNQAATIHGNRGVWALCRMVLLLLAITSAALMISNWRTRRSTFSSLIARKDLPIVSVYPRSVASSRIPHLLSGQTEVLVTDDNREAVAAIRTSIGMANNLRYKGTMNHHRRRKGGVAGALLGISNFISSLRGRRDDGFDAVVPGEIALESFDVDGMRSYLVMHGVQCSDYDEQSHILNGDSGKILEENTVLLRHDKLTTSMIAADDQALIDALWNRALQLFAWCQFANGDARGYVAHGTSVAGGNSRLQEMLEEARLAGIGMLVSRDASRSQPTERTHVNVHRVPLLIMPSGDASMDLSKRILHSLLSEEVPSVTPVASKSLLFEMNDGWLQDLYSLRREKAGQTNNLKEKITGESHDEAVREGGDSCWKFLESIVGEKSVGSNFRWLARYCQGESCSFVIDQNGKSDAF